MRRVRIVERPGETYTYAAVDRETGEVPLQLADRAALIALCERLGWAVHEEMRADKPREERQRIGERRQFGARTPHPFCGSTAIIVRIRSEKEKAEALLCL